MKLILTSFLFVIIAIANGQSIKYLENDPVWKVNRSYGPCVSGREYNYFLSGDTLINNKTYKKVFSKGYTFGLNNPSSSCPTYYNIFVDNTPIAYLRQDNKKIYCIYSNCLTKKEILLYNFDLKINDTVKFYESCDTNNFITAIVKTIDSIIVDNNYRKVFNLENINCKTENSLSIIIEGIGSNHDLFKLCDNYSEGNFLTCFGFNGKTMYSTNGIQYNLDVTMQFQDRPLGNQGSYFYKSPVKNK